jgi:hypothetical protein
LKKSVSEAEAAARAEAMSTSKRLKGKSYREANAPKASEKPIKPKVTVEVLISTKPLKRLGKSQSSSATEGDEVQEDDAPRPRKQRAVTKRPSLVISDEEDEDDPVSEYEEEQDESSTESRKKIPLNTKPPSSSSSYRSSHAETTSSEDEMDNDLILISDDDGQTSRKTKSKPVPRPRKKTESTASTNGTDGDDMDVDKPPNTNGRKSTKRKATDDKPVAKKQKRREDSDPWKLESAAVKRDWTEMRAPPLEMFHFARVVIDEYTYLDGKAHALVTNLTAERHWVLSGTPPIHDFAAVKTISAFLNVHLGVDDDGEGQSAQVKKRRREQTGKCPSRSTCH